MGIRPKGSGETLHLTNTADELADDLKATTEGFAKPFGEEIEEIAATAESANAASGELAKRVKALEDALGVGRVLAVDTPSQLAAMDKKAKVGDYILVASTKDLHKKVS